MDLQLPKTSIIGSHQRIARILKQGDKKETGLVALYQEKVKRGQPARFAFLTERGIKRAVDRNRLKRVARELARHNRDGLGNHESVFCLKKAALTQSYWQIKQDFDSLLSKG